MAFDPDDPALHEKTSMPPAHLKHSLSPVQQAHAAADARRQELTDMYVMAGEPLSQRAPDELMLKVQTMAAASAIVRSEGDLVVWASLLAICLEGWCAADRAEMMRLDTGEAA